MNMADMDYDDCKDKDGYHWVQRDDAESYCRKNPDR